MYFKSQNLIAFIEEEREAEQAMQSADGCVGQLAIDKRRQLVRHLVDYIVKNFGMFPTAYQKKSTAKAAIMVFPRLACKSSEIGGIVCINMYLYFLHK